MSIKHKKVLNPKRIAVGIVVAMFALSGLLIFSDDKTTRDIILYEALPFYQKASDKGVPQNSLSSLSKSQTGDESESESESKSEDTVTAPNHFTSSTDISTQSVIDKPKIRVIRIENAVDYSTSTGIISSDSVIFQAEEKLPQEPELEQMPFFGAPVDAEKLGNLEYVQSFYTVDKRTMISANDFDGVAFMARDLRISGTGPKVLIFHTHAYENYADSDPDNPDDGVVGVGRRLQEELSAADINVLHITDRFDLVDGQVTVAGSYERMENVIKEVLASHPSIEVVIDIHRDGVPNGTRLATSINGKSTAKVMFVNGLSKYTNKGLLTPITSLPNEHLLSNLAFSFQVQMAANELYPNLMRNIYLNAYRYSLHLAEKSLLIEVGAQTNTKQEAFNAVTPIANAILKILK